MHRIETVNGRMRYVRTGYPVARTFGSAVDVAFVIAIVATIACTVLA